MRVEGECRRNSNLVHCCCIFLLSVGCSAIRDMVPVCDLCRSVWIDVVVQPHPASHDALSDIEF